MKSCLIRAEYQLLYDYDFIYFWYMYVLKDTNINVLCIFFFTFQSGSHVPWEKSTEDISHIHL